MTEKKYNLVILTWVVLLLFDASPYLCAQNRVDSLKQILESPISDSLRAETYYRLGMELKSGKIGEAIGYIKNCITILEETKTSPNSLARAENSLGIIYYSLGDLENTLTYFYKALALYENKDVDSPMNLSSMYNNVGLVLLDLKRPKEAITYLDKARSLKLKQEVPLDIASVYNNIGLANQQLGNYEIAREYFEKALKIDAEEDNKGGLLSTNVSIGNNFFLQEQYDSTAFYYQRATMLLNQVEDKYSKAELMLDYGDLNIKQGKYNRAIEKFLTSLDWSTSINSLTLIERSYNGLATAYNNLNMSGKAFEYFVKYDSIKGLLYNDQQAKKIAEVEAEYNIQKFQKENELLLKEAEINDLKLANSQYLLYFLIGTIGLIGVIVFLQHRKNIYKSRTNQLLKEQNAEIIQKNKNIMDSILYAKNIQDAILPEYKKIQEVFQDAFVLSKARDVVSGDFYWFAEKGDKVIIAAVDCTGHGVPAAFLNVLGNTVLNQIVEEQNIIEPAAILQEMNRRVLTSLKNEKMHKPADHGMDIGICLFDRRKKTLSFAGAKRPLYYYNNRQLNILKGDHYPVGGFLYEEHREFNQHELMLNTDDSIYLFTDGIVDQFGGAEDKKFMYSRFQDMINQVVEKPMNDQQVAIENTIREWQGSNEQTDDILLIGVRV
ncbi:MAG: tetratricopeptide repeat protein [Bacteroidota bacterium]